MLLVQQARKHNFVVAMNRIHVVDLVVDLVDVDLDVDPVDIDLDVDLVDVDLDVVPFVDVALRAAEVLIFGNHTLHAYETKCSCKANRQATKHSHILACSVAHARICALPRSFTENLYSLRVPHHKKQTS